MEEDIKEQYGLDIEQSTYKDSEDSSSETLLPGSWDMKRNGNKVGYMFIDTENDNVEIVSSPIACSISRLECKDDITKGKINEALDKLLKKEPLIRKIYDTTETVFKRYKNDSRLVAYPVYPLNLIKKMHPDASFDNSLENDHPVLFFKMYEYGQRKEDENVEIWSVDGETVSHVLVAGKNHKDHPDIGENILDVMIPGEQEEPKVKPDKVDEPDEEKKMRELEREKATEDFDNDIKGVQERVVNELGLGIDEAKKRNPDNPNELIPKPGYWNVWSEDFGGEKIGEIVFLDGKAIINRKNALFGFLFFDEIDWKGDDKSKEELVGVLRRLKSGKGAEGEPEPKTKPEPVDEPGEEEEVPVAEKLREEMGGGHKREYAKMLSWYIYHMTGKEFDINEVENSLEYTDDPKIITGIHAFHDMFASPYNITSKDIFDAYIKIGIDMDFFAMQQLYRDANKGFYEGKPLRPSGFKVPLIGNNDDPVSRKLLNGIEDEYETKINTKDVLYVQKLLDMKGRAYSGVAAKTENGFRFFIIKLG